MNWNIIITTTVALVNVIVLLTMKFNDLKHLAKDNIEIKKRIDKITSIQIVQGERISKIEGILSKDK